ncbi:MAG: glutaredoxin 3 [Pseudomonadales bacterium]|nr:glutaredoxin 3 [Pseudomonadales bacterium]
MATVTLYTTRFCPYCVQAKRLLDSKGIQFTDIPVDNDHQKRIEMQEKGGGSTVPQIWIDDEHVGGCDELYLLERQNKLDGLLGL